MLYSQRINDKQNNKMVQILIVFLSVNKLFLKNGKEYEVRKEV